MITATSGTGNAMHRLALVPAVALAISVAVPGCAQVVGAAKAHFIPDTVLVRRDTIEIHGRVVAQSDNTEPINDYFVSAPPFWGRLEGTSGLWRYWNRYAELDCICLLWLDEGGLDPGAASPPIQIVAAALPALVPTWTRGEMHWGVEEVADDSVEYDPIQEEFFQDQGIGLEMFSPTLGDAFFLERVADVTTTICEAEFIASTACAALTATWSQVRATHASGGRNAARPIIDTWLADLGAIRDTQRGTIAYWILRGNLEFMTQWW